MDQMNTPTPDMGPAPRLDQAPYVLTLILAVLLALALRALNFDDYHHFHTHANRLFDGMQRLLGIAFGLQCLLFLMLVLLKLLPRLLRGQSHSRRSLLFAAALSSGLCLVNLLSECLVIYRLDMGSYELLLESLLLYGGLSLNFLVWYWLEDQPTRCGAALAAPAGRPAATGRHAGIVFPEDGFRSQAAEPKIWRPGFTDYLYFTILCSNCFGPPEGHSIVGARVKRLHILHSITLLSLFIVILARAINTLR